jgi:hypothetical protein
MIMVRPIKVRDAEQWKEEVVRLQRMVKAAYLDPNAHPAWKAAVHAFVDGLSTILDPTLSLREAVERASERVAPLLDQFERCEVIDVELAEPESGSPLAA